jgi:hypothetical protein
VIEREMPDDSLNELLSKWFAEATDGQSVLVRWHLSAAGVAFDGDDTMTRTLFAERGDVHDISGLLRHATLHHEKGMVE